MTHSRKFSKMDGSDQKSINNLMDQLKKLQESAKKNATKDSKENKNSPSTSRKRSPKRPSRARKKPKVDNDSPKISSWLKKIDTKEVQPLNVTVNRPKDKANVKNAERDFSEKYRVSLPSVTKILADQKKFEEHKNQVKLLDTLDNEWLERDLNSDYLKESEEYSGELLDCKHLTAENLSEAFGKYSTTLKDIMSGKKHSERHQRFEMYSARYNFTNMDLRYSNSTMVFTQKQKDHLVSLMRENLDLKNGRIDYFFKVLLPELCLFIFMDVHEMTNRQANKYLNERPLDE